MSTERRFFSPVSGSLGVGELTLGDEAARHASVLRLREGDAVTLFDGRGGEADAIVREVTSDTLRVDVTGVRAAVPDGKRVVLVQCMPKGAKLEDIVRACTEIGVGAVHLAHAERSVAKPDDARGAKRTERLERVAREAARQSERSTVPPIVAPAPLREVAARAPHDALRLVLCAREGEAWDARIEGVAEVWVVVGPEGGLSAREEDALVQRGWARARIHTGIMRVETAAPVALALLVDRLER